MAGNRALKSMITSRALRVVVALLMALATGCYPHVQLSLPPPGASLDARAEAYEKLRPEMMHSTTVVAQGVVSTSSRSMDYLKLADGTLVRYPEDLRPLVRKESPTAKHIDRSTSRRTLAIVLAGTMVALLATGVGLGISYVMAEPDARSKPVLIGAGVAIGAGIGVGITGQWAGTSSSDAAEDAYRSYDAELRHQLGLEGKR
jgi:hypothetical protein